MTADGPGFDIAGGHRPPLQWYDPRNMGWRQVRQNIGEFFHGIAIAGYEKKLREQYMELNDLFMLLCFMDLVGLPNPATIYLMEVYPYFLEEFHVWHRRMGMDHSPLGNLPCC